MFFLLLQLIILLYIGFFLKKFINLRMSFNSKDMIFFYTYKEKIKSWFVFFIFIFVFIFVFRFLKFFLTKKKFLDLKSYIEYDFVIYLLKINIFSIILILIFMFYYLKLIRSLLVIIIKKHFLKLHYYYFLRKKIYVKINKLIFNLKFVVMCNIHLNDYIKISKDIFKCILIISIIKDIIFNDFIINTQLISYYALYYLLYNILFFFQKMESDFEIGTLNCYYQDCFCVTYDGYYKLYLYHQMLITGKSKFIFKSNQYCSIQNLHFFEEKRIIFYYFSFVKIRDCYNVAINNKPKQLRKKYMFITLY